MGTSVMQGRPTLHRESFGTLADGRAATLWTMTLDGAGADGQGLSVSVTDYGGIVTRIMAPDRHGRLANVVLGFATVGEYETKSAEGGLFFGALIGRFANRIAGGRFTLDGVEHVLETNNGANTLHGGSRGFDKRLWACVAEHRDAERAGITLRLVSPDGDANFPGTLTVDVSYSLSAEGLRIDYAATTDRLTVINLTNHAYFNLAGIGAPHGVVDHLLFVDADRFLPTDAGAIPLPGMADVAGTPFDFRTAKPIGRDLRSDDPQIRMALGYDHNWVLNKSGHGGPRLAARLVDPESGRTLECLTTEPGVQIYTGNFMTGAYGGHGVCYRQTDGVTLETQHFPDSPNRPDFPTTELKPGDRFESTTIFRFGITRI